MNVLEQMQTWWQSMGPQMQGAIRAGGVLLLALMGAKVLAAMVVRTLRARNFDALLRLPGSAATASEQGITPTWIAGVLVRVTVWAGAGWWLAQQYGRADLASTIGLILSRMWAVTAIVVAALAFGSMLAHRLIDFVQGLKPEAARNGSASSYKGAAGAVGAGAYILVTLIVLLISADLFNWPLTRTSALALWQFAQHIMIAAAALFIGCLGARWARELTTSDGASSPEKQAGQYTALGIIAATTILAVSMMLSIAGVLLGLAALAILGAAAWLTRGYLPDIVAGLQLRTHKVSEVYSDGEMWQVSEIGFLTTQVCRGGEMGRLPNRVVLEARFKGAPAEQNGSEQNGSELAGSRRLG